MKEKDTYSLLSNIRFILSRLWKRFKIILVLMLISIIAQIALPYIYIYLPRMIIEQVMDKVEIRTMIISLIKIGVPIVLLSYLNGQAMGRFRFMTFKVRVSYGEDSVNKVLDCDYAHLEKASFHESWSKSAKSTMNPDSGTEHIMNDMINFAINLLGLVLYSYILFSLNVIIIFILVLVSIINLYMQNRTVKYSKSKQSEIGRISKKISYIRNTSNNIEGAKDIKVFSTKNMFMNIISTANNNLYLLQKNIMMKEYGALVVNTIVLLIKDFGAYVYLIYLVTNNNITVAEFVFFFGAIAGFSIWVNGLVNSYTELKRCSIDISNLREFLDMPSNHNHGEGIPLPEGVKGLDIEFKDVSYKYESNDDYIIKDFNLKIGKGEKLAVVGVNGAGKTTLIKLLCGLLQPTSGEILINGNNINEYNVLQLYTLFSIVFQDLLILPNSVKQNITISSNDIDERKLLNSIMQAGLEEKFKTIESLDTLLMRDLNVDGINLSGGETQKLLMARALYKDAPILILDEPTAALDPIAEHNLYMKYNEFAENKTTIFISHRLATTRFCDRIILINNGRITECGTHAQLLIDNKEYAHIFELQSYYYKEELANA